MICMYNINIFLRLYLWPSCYPGSLPMLMVPGLALTYDVWYLRAISSFAKGSVRFETAHWILQDAFENWSALAIPTSLSYGDFEVLCLSWAGTGAVAGSMVARVNVQNLSCAAALHSGLQEATSDRSNRCIALRFTVIISIEIHPAEFFDLLLATNCFSVLDVSYDLPVPRSFDTHSNGWRYEWPPSTSHTHTSHIFASHWIIWQLPAAQSRRADLQSWKMHD